ncbi:MAG: thrombospondin type 3 repeat-containing protein, partial [Actinomycetota bacterium]|nr:thrombospondin type 3 repeat-containing protein [Actinomycetota bacterium]
MFALPVVAQERGFRAHRFDGTPAGGWQFLVDRPWYATGLSGAAGLTLDYSYRSLVPGVALGPGELRPIVEHAWIGHADLSLSVFERFLLSVNLPVTLREGGALYPAAPAGPSQFTVIGDPRLGLTYRLFGHPERDRFSVHLGLDGWAPLGAPDDHQGDTGFRLQPRAVFAGTFADRGHWGVEAALLLRPYASIGPPSLGLIAASEARLGLALGASFLDGRLRVGPEVRFSTQVVGQDAFSVSGSSLELLGGAQLLLGDRLMIGLAGGTALLDAAGTPDARAMIRVGWAPRRDADGRAQLPPPVAAASPTPAREQAPPVSGESGTSGPSIPATGTSSTAAPGAASSDSTSAPAAASPTPEGSSAVSAPAAGSPTAEGSPTVSAPAAGSPSAEGSPAASVPSGLELPPPPVLDADNDGVSDAMDRCPFEPETQNGIRDQDGCPEAELERGTPLARILAPESNPPSRAPVPAEPDAQTPAPQPEAATSDLGKLDSDGDGVMDEADRCPLTSEDVDGFEDDDGCPELDNDADGVPDTRDECPLVGDTVHGAGSRNGCPKLPADADKDGVTDDADRCPFEPETRNGVRDEDGCPEPEGRSRPALARLLAAPPAPASSAQSEPEGSAVEPTPSPLAGIDSDRDGIPDDADRCPLTREDADGFEDLDGCPESDNDGDGVPDSADLCPLEAETPNGWRDEDGCADERSDLDGDGIDYVDDRCPLEPGA